jgi:hypothetical protein
VAEGTDGGERAEGIQALDPELDAALRKVLQIVHRDHPLTANQLLVLAAELERLGLHRLVEEHLGRRDLRAGRRAAEP